MGEEKRDVGSLWKHIPLVLSLATLGLFIRGVMLIALDEGQATAGPVAMSDGFCFGSLWIISSCFIGVFAFASQAAVEYYTQDDDFPVLIVKPDSK